MNRTFQRNSWSMEGLTHAWSIRFAPMPEFHQQDDYIENLPAPVLRDGYSYVSLLTTDKISPKVKLTTHCSFEGSGAPLVVPALPYLLSFSAGAMLYVVVEELIPEMSEGEHSNIGTIFFAVGFTLMMMLDVALG